MTQWDASSVSFIRNQHYGCMYHAHSLASLMSIVERGKETFFFPVSHHNQIFHSSSSAMTKEQ